MDKVNLFLLAPPRSGTTQLFRWLETHSDIEGLLVKEPNYFSNESFPAHIVSKFHINDVDPSNIAELHRHTSRSYQYAVFRSLSDYHNAIKDSTARFRLDASTSYFNDRHSVQKILEYNPDAKFIIVLRDPVKRLVSQYRLAIRIGLETRSLKDCLEEELREGMESCEKNLIRESLYSEGLSRVLEKIKAENREIILFEDMVSNPSKQLARIANLLGIQDGCFDLSVLSRNEGVLPRFPAINRAFSRRGIKTKLREILPTTVKQSLKRIYFSPAKMEVPLDDVEPFLCLLEEDVKKYQQILPRIRELWCQ